MCSYCIIATRGALAIGLITIWVLIVCSEHIILIITWDQVHCIDICLKSFEEPQLVPTRSHTTAHAAPQYSDPHRTQSFPSSPPSVKTANY